MAKFIQSSKARELAYSWHGGQNSDLYAFASSGLIADLNSLIREIDSCAQLAGTKSDCRALVGLRRFVQSSLIARIPGKYPFAAPWSRIY